MVSPAFAIFSGGSLLLVLAWVLWVGGSKPEAQALGLIGSVIIAVTVLAAFWIASPTGLHSDADVRASAQPDRLTWDRN